MSIRWLEDVGATDIESVGGKGASLGELTGAGLPVPPGYVVTADTYRSFIEETGIADELFSAVDIDPEDSAALAAAHERASELILETPLPDETREENPTGEGKEDVNFYVGKDSTVAVPDNWAPQFRVYAQQAL